MSHHKNTEPVKAGCLLKYKKRIFKPNWRQSDVVLYSDSSIVTKSAKSRSSGSRIRMTAQTTLVVFGRQLLDVPKKPLLPPGYSMEQLLAIGMIYDLNNGKTRERLSIVFHWFLTPNVQELFDWILAINTIIPANKQLFTDEELTMSLVLSETLHCNNLKLAQDARANHADHSGTATNAESHAAWTLSNAEAVTDGYLGADATGNFQFTADQPNDFLNTSMGVDMDYADFDDCCAGGDAFAVF
ncbi:hypothetical protein HDE_02698 [Halotydeus destructor]|nr:hypothetical protein HDE_02698 [Halotydeus destructor]